MKPETNMAMNQNFVRVATDEKKSDFLKYKKSRMVKREVIKVKLKNICLIV